MKKYTLIGRYVAMAAAIVVIANAHGDTIVFNNALGAGSQQNYDLGMDFVVNTAVTVTELGAFDSGGDGFSGTIQVGIFDLSGNLIGSSASLTGTAGTLIGGSRFAAVTAFTLNPGTYSIVAAGFDLGTDFSGNTGLGGVTSFNSDGGAVSLVAEGGRWDTGNTFQLPTQNVGGYGQPDPVFQAGTFAVGVPDGGLTIALLGGALVGLQALRRKLFC